MTDANTLPYCSDCDSVPCECDSFEVHPKFLLGRVDPDTLLGFKTAQWASMILQDGPIRVDPISDAFWEYDSGVWREARNVVAKRLPSRLGDAARSGSAAHVSAYLYSKLHRAGEYIHPDRPNVDYVSVPSGLFEISTGAVVGHNPAVMTTYQLQVDPDFDSPTPEFDKFLVDVLHPGDVGRVLDILGYLLLPGNPGQKAIMFSGRGRNGKGVLLQVIESIIGKHHAATVSLQELGTRFAAADLYGRPINIVGDIDGEHITHTGRFKQMTGGDTVRMDVKNARAFSGKVWAVPVFSANAIPTSADTSHGYLRRWEVVEFPNTFDGSDVTLVDRLLAEMPAIAGKLLRHGAAHPFTIRESAPGKEAHAMFANRSDPVRTWLSDTHLHGFVERQEAYSDYRFWIEDGNGRTALTRNKFYERVSAVLGDPVTRKGVRGWDVGPEKVAPQMAKVAPQMAKVAPRVAPYFGASPQFSEDRGAEGAVFANSARGMCDETGPGPSVARVGDASSALTGEGRADVRHQDALADWDPFAAAAQFGERADTIPDPFASAPERSEGGVAEPQPGAR